MKPRFHKTILALLLGTLAIVAMVAHAEGELPPPQQAGGIEYLSGGIGQDESRAIEQASRQWPLTLEFALRAGTRAEFVSNVQVVLRDRRGDTVLQTTTTGPFLLVRLPPGRYRVDATFADKTLGHMAVVKAGQPAKVVFVWPAGTGDARP